MTEQSFHRRATWSALAITGVVAVFGVAVVLVTIAAQAMILTFAAVMFACGLRALSSWLASKLHIHIGWCIAACAAVFVVAMSVLILVGIPHVVDKATQMSGSAEHAYATLQQTRFGKVVFAAPNTSSLTSGATMERMLGVLGTVGGAFGAFAYVFFVTLYLASVPDTYRSGLVRLFPVEKRERVNDVLDTLARTMARWLLSRVVSMVVVFAATTVGLWLLKVPFAKTLGLIAGLSVFVPNIGPIAATAPALLVGWTVDPAHFFYVGALYLGVAIADGYGLTPLIQERAVDVPSALILMAQVVAGALWGALGIAVATPLLACIVIIVRKVYVEDTLEGHASAATAAH